MGVGSGMSAFAAGGSFTGALRGVAGLSLAGWGSAVVGSAAFVVSATCVVSGGG